MFTINPGKTKTGTPSATLPGSAYGGGGAYGGVPSVPNPIATAGQAVGGDIANLGQIYDLSKSVNSFNQGQLLNQYQSAIPNYSGMIAQQSGNIGQELQGQVPSDVINQIMQQAAERGIMTGSPGGPNSNAAYLRALGLTSLGVQQQGTENLKTAIGEAPVAQPFDVSKMFITPEQQQQAQMAANLYASAPDPTAAAQAAIGASAIPMYPQMGTPTVGSGARTTSPWYEPPAVASWSASDGTDIPTGSADPYADWNQWAAGISAPPQDYGGDMMDFYGGGESGYLGQMDEMLM